MLFLGADASWTRNRPEMLYGSYYEGIVERITSRQTRETAEVVSVGIRASKGFDWKRLKTEAACAYSHYDSPVLLQDEIIRYNGNSVQASLDVSLAPFRWLAFSYEGRFYQSQTRMAGGEAMPTLRTLRNNASPEFYLPGEITLGAAVSHYYNNQNREHPSFLLGEATAGYSRKRWSITVACDNLFNRETYVYTTSIGLTEHTSVYRIRPRSVLLKIRFSIF